VIRVQSFFSLILASILVFAYSCKDDDAFYLGSDVQLVSSADTIVFDTVFTSFSPNRPLSVNKQFTLYNPYKESVRTSFTLGGGEQSYFRFNVDGTPGPVVNDVVIESEDSIFVFVEVSIDPNNDPESRPLIINDSLIITTNGVQQDVNLVAWGQDAHYFDRDTLCNAVIDDTEKPYVVYGYLYVPENCQLTIREGVTMHFAPSSWLFVEGQLNVEGSAENPVRFEGDRLQPSFEEVPGQWGGIWFDFLSKDSKIDHAMIKNGTVGIYCDSSSSNGNPTVQVSNTLVRNMSFDGLSGKGSHLTATNSVFANCGRHSFLGLWGGNYDLRHCTFVTYNFDFNRRLPTAVFNSNRYDDFGRIIETFNISASMQNCIVYGSLEEEFALDIDTAKLDFLRVTNNLIRSSIPGLDATNLGNVVNKDPSISGYTRQVYEIDSTSAAIDIGTSLTPPILFDITGANRDSKPDAGAYEFLK
jgi:hypothetical protein